MTDAPALTLVYFPFPGRAAAIRDTLRIGGIAFEDRHLAFDEFGAMKAAEELPFGAVPVLIVGDDARMISQSNAILRYAGKLAGLYPSDPLEALRVDEALDACDDGLGAIGPSIREPDPERKAAMRKELAEVALPRDFARFERLLAANGGPFLAGPNLTIADLKVFHALNKLTDGSLDGIPTSVADPFAALQAWKARVAAERDARL